MNKIVVLLILNWTISFVHSQNSIPPLSYLTTEKGLSQAISYDIFQDSRGYMWFTSYDGINKFDSNKITKFTYDYNDDSSFWGNLSIGIVEDKKGNIWTGGTNYLNIYQYNQNKFKHIKVKDNSDFYHYPLFATSNAVIFQKGNRFYSSDVNSFKTTLFYTDKNFDYVNFSAKTYETPNTYIVFIRGKSGKDELDSKITFRVYEFSKTNLPSPKITSINTTYDVNALQKINENQYLIGTDNGLKVFDYTTKKVTNYLLNQFKEAISSLAKTNENKVLLSTINGKIYELDLDNETINLQTFFSDEDAKECEKNGIKKLFVDKQDNVFFTLWGKGIACYNQNNSLFNYHFTKSDIENKTINDQYISSMLSLKNNDILVYTKSGDFYTINQNGKNITQIANINTFNKTNFGGDLYLHKGFDDRIFMSGLDVLYELKINEKKIVPVTINCEGLVNNMFNDVAFFGNNHYIIAAQKGIYIVSKDFKTSFTFDIIDSNEVYTRTYFVQNKYLYVCRPYKGFDLYKYESKKLKKIKSFEINASIKDIFIKNTDEVWFASTLGILKHTINTNTVALDNSKNKWINSYLYCLLPDKYGNIWASHNAGITKYEIAKNKTTHYNLSHGLQGYEFNTSAFAKNTNGVLFFGGTNGINSINPNENTISKNKTIIHFEELKIADKIVNDVTYNESKRNLTLANNQTTFSLKPVLINYNSCFLQHDLMYKLEGIDKNWISGQSNQTMRYSNLPAGKYKFYVKTPDNSEQKVLAITVNQVFWKSIWFWVIISLLIISIIWYAQRGYYKAQVNEREAELKKMKAIELERERIAHDMHDDLGSGLTTIAYLSQSASNDSNKKIQDKSRELIKNMSEIIWSMKSENDSITELVSYVKSYSNYYCEENNLEVNFDINLKDENLQLNGDFRKNIYLIIKESLHNIVKHAKATKVVITFECVNELIVSIQDNGIGINLDTSSKGNGIKNIKNRVAKLNGTVDFIVKEGTTTKFFIPIDRLEQ